MLYISTCTHSVTPKKYSAFYRIFLNTIYNTESLYQVTAVKYKEEWTFHKRGQVLRKTMQPRSKYLLCWLIQGTYFLIQKFHCGSYVMSCMWIMLFTLQIYVLRSGTLQQYVYNKEKEPNFHSFDIFYNNFLCCCVTFHVSWLLHTFKMQPIFCHYINRTTHTTQMPSLHWIH
jgi:hypothetical protein